MAHYGEWEFAGRTDTGLVRTHNEDAIAIDADYAFAVLADGMGGYNAGEVASGMATQIVRDALECQCRTGAAKMGVFGGQSPNNNTQHHIVEAVLQANRKIFDAANAIPRYSGMGTTLVVAVFHADKVIIGHVGDSRVYRFRDNNLVQLTRDHSLLQEQIDAGVISAEQARYSQHKNLVTRAVGVAFDVQVEITCDYPETGDIYLLCSDGLSDMCSSVELAEALAHPGGLPDACEELVHLANQHGGLDNISVILVRVLPHPSKLPAWVRRMLAWVS